jgi:hypothetical protein
MAAIFTICPVSGQEIPTGIEIDMQSLDKVPTFQSRIRCPHCRDEHNWSQASAWLRDHDGSVRRWSDEG